MTDSLMGRMGVEPILPVKLPIIIESMLNFDGDEHGDVRCVKRTLIGIKTSTAVKGEYDTKDKYRSRQLLSQYVIQGSHGTGKRGSLEVHFSRRGKHKKFA